MTPSIVGTSMADTEVTSEKFSCGFNIFCILFAISTDMYNSGSNSHIFHLFSCVGFQDGFTLMII